MDGCSCDCDEDIGSEAMMSDIVHQEFGLLMSACTAPRNNACRDSQIPPQGMLAVYFD